jgi:hypothetical protein
MRRTLFAHRVSRHPNFGASSRTVGIVTVQAKIRNRLGLINPRQQDFRLRFDAVQLCRRPANTNENSPAFGPDTGFADIDEFGQPLFRGNGRFHFGKRATHGRIERSPRALPLPTSSRGPPQFWQTSASWPSLAHHKRHCSAHCPVCIASLDLDNDQSNALGRCVVLVHYVTLVAGIVAVALCDFMLVAS